MNAIILVGGLGTRLRPLTLTQPKPLLPVLNKPFLTYQLDLLRQAGIHNVMLGAGKVIQRWERGFKRLSSKELKLHISYEPFPLGTGGAIRFAYDALKKARVLRPGPVLVFNGDIFFDFHVKDFLSAHVKQRSDGTILLREVEDATRFGVVSVDKKGRIRRFVEKPKTNSFGRLINAGAYALTSDWIEKIPPKKVLSVERDIFPAALRRGDRMFGFKMKGYWNDIGTPASYLAAHRDLLMNSNRWTGKGLLRKRGRLIESTSSFGKNVILEGFMCCGRNVVVLDGAHLRDCVLMDNVVIGRGASIDGSVLGRGCRIGEYSTIRTGSVLADLTSLPPFTKC